MRSYPDLVNDVRAFLNRKDLDEQIPRFIMLAEQDLFRRLRATCNETIVTYTAQTVGYPINSAVRLPDSCIELKSVVFNGIPLQYISESDYFERLKREPGQQIPIEIEEQPEAGFPVPPEAAPMVGELLPPELIADAELDRFAYPPWLTPAPGYYVDGTGRPQYFTRINNYLCFHPIAESPVGHELYVNMFHYDGPVDSANPYTSTLQDAYSAYLYGALSHAEGYLLNDPRIALWKSKFEEVLGQLNGTRTDADLGSVQEIRSVYA